MYAIGEIAKWLTKEDSREATRDAMRQRMCRHRWERINEPGDSIVLIAADEEWCVKCNARR